MVWRMGTECYDWLRMESDVGLWWWQGWTLWLYSSSQITQHLKEDSYCYCMFYITAGIDKHLTFRRSSVAAHSDSSSDTGGGGTNSKPKRKDMSVAAVPAPAPQMRYNRAFRYTVLLQNLKQVLAGWQLWSTGTKKPNSHDKIIELYIFCKSLQLKAISIKFHLPDASEHHNKVPDCLSISMNFVSNMNYYCFLCVWWRWTEILPFLNQAKYLNL